MHSDLDHSQITSTLYIGITPSNDDMAMLSTKGVRLLINMRIERPIVTRPWQRVPALLWVPSIDYWLFPIRPWYIRRAVRRALRAMDAGYSVYCCCQKGRHRSVLMAACILVAQGSSVTQAMAVIKRARPVADPEAPHIYRGITAFAASWNRQHR